MKTATPLLPVETAFTSAPKVLLDDWYERIPLSIICLTIQQGRRGEYRSRNKLRFQVYLSIC